MSVPKFDKRDRLKLVGYDNKTYWLRRNTWNIKTKQPERWYLKFNFDKIELTIAYPEEVRRSTKRADSKILYRKFSQMTIAPNITASWDGYIAVVIDTKTNRIQTIYPTRKIKEGEKLWPI